MRVISPLATFLAASLFYGRAGPGARQAARGGSARGTGRGRGTSRARRTATHARRPRAWLDGFLPFALARGDIAGGIVVVVKDGEVLLEKGYGYADVEKKKPVDPQDTLFRPGSVSKLFTWTAVMQEVERGKLDLDTDVNQYLDFEIPPRPDGEPVTLRDLMTHTGGSRKR